MDNDIQGKHFCITGTLWVTREEVEDIIKECGGIADKTVTKNTDYLLVGEKPGKSKLAKAAKYGTRIINSSDFEQMVKAVQCGKKDTECIKNTTP
jgi:NAD-dependent DNA ligase